MYLLSKEEKKENHTLKEIQAFLLQHREIYEWQGMACYGVVWCGVVLCAMAWHGMAWHGMAWYGMVFYYMSIEIYV